MWDVFKTSTEKLAGCHLELVRKLQELIKEVQKYVDDQAKAHKKVRCSARERVSESECVRVRRVMACVCV